MKATNPSPAGQWILLRRSFFLALCVGTTLVIGREMYSMMQTNGLNVLKMAVYALFLLLVTPIVLSFWTAALGFVVRWRGGDSLELTRPADEATPPDGH